MSTNLVITEALNIADEPSGARNANWVGQIL